MASVIVVTYPELGWDSVVRVFDSRDSCLRSFKEDHICESEEEMNDNGYILTEIKVEK